MVWCLLSPAAILAVLGLAALTLDLRSLRPPRLPRLSPSRALRGCLSGTLILIAGGLVALAVAVQSWQP